MSTAKPSVTDQPAPVVVARRLGLAAVALLLAVVGLLWLGGTAQAQTPVNWQFQDLDGPGVSGGNGRSTDQVAPVGTSTVIFAGAPHVFYDAEGLLRHAWWTGVRWQFETLDGEGGANGQTTDPVGGGSVAFLYAGEPHVYYFGNPNGALRHAWYSTRNLRWNFEVLDGPDATGGNGRSANAMAGDAGWTIFDNAPHLFYQDTVTKRLRHAWYSTVDFDWRFEDLDGPGVAGGNGRTATDINAQMSSVAFGGVGEPHVFYRSGADEASRLRHAWYSTSNFRWNFENLDGPGVAGGNGRSEVATGFSSSTVLWNGTPHVFMRDGADRLRQAWFNPVAVQWFFNTLTTPATCGAGCEPGAEPSALVFGTPHVFHRDSAQGRLLQTWWTGTTWAFQALDGPGVSGGAGRTTDETGASPSSVVFNGFPQVFNVDTTEGRLRQAWFGPVPPANTVAPTITGTAVTGETLTGSNGTWTNSPTTFTRQWLRCDAVVTTTCTVVAGQTATTYAVSAPDIGFRIGLRVTARNSVGSSTASATVTNVVAPPGPQITTVTPNTGTNNGGTGVTITGQFLTGATSVTFGGTAGTSLVVVSDTQLTVLTPAKAPGAVDVVVTTPQGSATSTGGFTYTQAPPANTVAPAVTGTVAFGETLTVSDGTWTESPTSFAYTWQRCTLLFDIFEICLPIEGATANTYVVVRDDIGTFLKGVVAATNAGGTTPATSAPTATVPRPAPVISSLSPTTGSNNGGTSVTITGDFLTGSTGATFDGVAGTAYTVVNEFSATVTTPAGGVGAVPVVVQSPIGASNASSFTYSLGVPANTAAPAVTGTVAIGQVLSVSNGTWTNSPTSFAYQWQRCAGAVCTDIPTQQAASYQITEADAGSTLRAVVTATNATGSGTATPSAATTAVPVPAPSITSLTPTTGPDSGGTEVVITGQYFTGATDVSFGVESAASFTVDSDTQITAVTPAGDAGAVGVSVTTPSGSDVEAAAFTYTATVPVPLIDFIDPGSGPLEGGTVVTLTGSNFTGVTAATVGGEPATFSVVDDTTMTVTTPPAAEEGTVDLVVTNAGGPGVPSSFTYSAAPFVITPPGLDDLEPGVGDTVTVTDGTWTGSPTFTYQWGRCEPFPPVILGDCEILVGETSSSYTVAAGDVGFRIGVVVTATNAFGTNEESVFTATDVPSVP